MHAAHEPGRHVRKALVREQRADDHPGKRHSVGGEVGNRRIDLGEMDALVDATIERFATRNTGLTL